MNTLVFGNVLAAGILCSAALAEANTVTFDSLPSYFDVLSSGTTGSPYVENGVTVTSTQSSSVLAWYTGAGAAHIDDSGTDFTSGLIFTMASAFDAVSFTLTSLGYDFLDVPGPLSNNIFVTGMAGGATVATASYTLSDVYLDVQTFLLGSAFTGLDALLIELQYPVNTALCGAPCGHFDLDEVVLAASGPAPVPLPASGLLLGAAILLLSARKRRNR